MGTDPETGGAGDLPGPVRVISDLHLGHRASKIGEIGWLTPLLDGVGMLVCAGDAWEEIAEDFREDGRRMVAELKALADGAGVELVFMPGNHDPGAPGPGFLELAGGGVLVTHGHALFRDGAPWSRMLPERRPEVERVWREAGMVRTLAERLRVANEVARVLVAPHYPHGRSVLARLWDAAVPPVRAWRMLEAWRKFPAEAARMAAHFSPGAGVVVIGHFHHAGIWRREGRWVINTGSFMPPGAAWCADIQANRVTVRKIRKKSEGFVADVVLREIENEGPSR